MKIADLGEFELIDRLRKIIDEFGVGIKSTPDLLVGIGDDAAVWLCNSSAQLGTIDTLVQNIHFDLSITSWQDLGWKALAANISDIAAMGGTPAYTMVSLGLPSDTELDQVIDLYKGMAQIANEYDMCIAGGDISESPMLTITPTVIGNVEKENILSRSGATLGDQIAVTGYLGTSAAGLKLLQWQIELDSETDSVLKESHLRPRPRIAEAQLLVKHGIKSAVDVSDGLIADLTHICQASKVGARVFLSTIPIHIATTAAFPDEATILALTGGEDYELVFTASSDTVKEIQKHIETPVTVIGEIVNEIPGTVTLLDENGKAVHFNKGGWEHFGLHF